MAVNELLSSLQRPHLIEKQIAWPVMNEAAVVEVEGLRLMRLTAADYHRPSTDWPAQSDERIPRESGCPSDTPVSINKIADFNSMNEDPL
jgi:hypothetical protein